MSVKEKDEVKAAQPGNKRDGRSDEKEAKKDAVKPEAKESEAKKDDAKTEAAEAKTDDAKAEAKKDDAKTEAKKDDAKTEAAEAKKDDAKAEPKKPDAAPAATKPEPEPAAQELEPESAAKKPEPEPAAKKPEPQKPSPAVEASEEPKLAQLIPADQLEFGDPDAPAPPPGKAPPGDSRSMRRWNGTTEEFVLIYRDNTFLITRQGVVGKQGVWTCIEYPSQGVAANAYAHACSDLTGSGFIDLR